MGQTPNNFIIIKSITVILVYISRLKKNLSYFSLLSHTQIISLKGDNTLHSPFYFFSTHSSLSWLSSFSISGSLLAALSFFLCGNPCYCSLFNVQHTSSICSSLFPLVCILLFSTRMPFIYKRNFSCFTLLVILGFLTHL